MLVDTSDIYNRIINDLKSEDAFVIDVETNGLDAFGHNQICGIGVGALSSEDTYYFPMRHQQGTNLPHEYIKDLLNVLSSGSTFIGYNLKFDLHFLVK